jgi:hypothetical protein
LRLNLVRVLNFKITSTLLAYTNFMFQAKLISSGVSETAGEISVPTTSAIYDVIRVIIHPNRTHTPTDVGTLKE